MYGPRLLRVPLDDGIDPVDVAGTLTAARSARFLDPEDMHKAARRDGFHGALEDPLVGQIGAAHAVRSALFGPARIDRRLVTRRNMKGLA